MLQMLAVQKLSYKINGYDKSLRQQAMKWFSDGMNFRRIARQLNINHQTVMTWVYANINQLPLTNVD